jgi:galactokinase
MSTTSFETIFGLPPEASAQAPGRVNLLGEHTDYNDGFVLPIAVHLATTVEISHSPGGSDRFYAVALEELIESAPQGPVPKGFAAYIHGCLSLLRQGGYPVGPVSLRVESRIPMGVGLSSSAALEVAVLRAARELFRLAVDDVWIAQTAQQAEIRYAGVNCGIMDQMAASLADATHMLFLDTRTLERKILPLPKGAELLVLDSGVARRLEETGYNRRRRECEEAAFFLGVKALRDVAEISRLAELPPDLARRARHVVSENRRVLKASAGVDAASFGALMNASHASLRDDFEVSVPQLDLLVELLQGRPEVFGARLTGAGFGGACVALVRKGSAAQVAADVLDRYAASGYHGLLLVPQ